MSTPSGPRHAAPGQPARHHGHSPSPHHLEPDPVPEPHGGRPSGSHTHRFSRRRRPPLVRLGLVLALLLGCLALAPSSSTSPARSVPAPTPTAEVAGPPAPLKRTVRRSPGAPGAATTSGDQLTRGVSMRSTTVADKGFSYCGNGSIDTPSPEIQRVVFVVHGNDRQPCNVAGSVLAAANDQQRRTTLVVAPRFPTAEDKIDRSSQLYWTFNGWSQGDASVNPGAQASSYAVLDELLGRVRNLPQVVAGFSGGGQFVGRFMVGSRANPERFVIANPSSYLYYDNRRPGTPPAQLAECPGYDDYRYGLKKLNPYMTATGSRGLADRFRTRQVVYLVGDADNDPRSSSMDKTCGANAQGRQRVERAQRYWAYLPSVFGPQIRQHQKLYLVPGVSHDSTGVFRAPQAKQALFGE